MSKRQNDFSLSALKITLIYLVVAAVWIAFTDHILRVFVTDPQYLSTLQTYKGGFYVTVTSLGLYWLIRKYSRELIANEIELTDLLSDLRSEKELKDILFERIPVMITIYDPDLEEFEVNHEFEKVMGWTNEELDEQDIDLLEACYPDFETRQEAVEFMNSPGVGWKEFSMETKSGDKVPTSWTNVRLTDNTSVGIGIDMTDIKASQAKIRESQQLLQKTFDSLKASVILVDPENRTIVDCNSSAEDIFGYNREELIGSSTEILHTNKANYKKFDEIGKDTLEQHGVFKTEFQMQKKDGTVFHSDHTVTFVYDKNGNVDKVVSVVRDITDQKEYEQQLKRRQQRLLQSQKIGKIGDWEFDPETEEIYWSPMMYEIYDRDPDRGVPAFEEIQSHYYGSDSDKHNRKVQKALDNGESYDIDLQLNTEGGNHKYIRAMGLPVSNDDEKITKLRGIVQDITERKESEQKLKERNTFIETTLENLPIGVAVNTIDEGEQTFMNKKFCEIYGWPKEVLNDVGTFLDKVFKGDQVVRKRFIEALNSRNPERMQWSNIRITTQEGTEKVVNAKNIPLYEQNLMISTVIDVTEQKELEEKLRQSEGKYRELFLNNPEPMWIYNPENLAFVEVNKAAIEHYGYSEEEFLDMTLADIRPPEDVEALKQDIEEDQGQTSYSEDWRHITKDGRTINVEISASDVEYQDETYRLVLVNDVTEQKRIQEKIIQSIIEGEDRERKRIAQELHDGLGQYLVAANMNFQSIEEDVGQLPDKRNRQFKTGLSHLKKALSETRSIAYNLMPKAIADYGVIVALKNLIQDFRDSSDIAFELRFNTEKLNLPKKAEVNIYRILQEVISNAVRHSECSRISVILKHENNMLLLKVEDNGIGMELDTDQEERGLGLRSIKTRVRSLNGDLTIRSQPGKGTKISITVPNVDKLQTKRET